MRRAHGAFRRRRRAVRARRVRLSGAARRRFDRADRAAGLVMSAPAMDWLTLASSLDAAGETDRALAVLDVAVSADSSANEALELKGNLLRSRGELRQAAEVFDLLGRRDPDHPYAR